MSTVSRTRATNLTGLIDIDALVEANLLRQKTKLNTATQKLKVQQYKQEQYREVITKSKNFYNKYCDILSGGNFLTSSTYNVMKATSSDNNNVTATASTKAKAGSYEVTVSTAATAAKYQMDKDQFMSATQITINNVAYNLTGDTASERAENLNKQLKEKGEVTASFSNFVENGKGGLVLQTVATGKDAELSIFVSGGSATNVTADDATSKAESESLSFANVSGQNSIIIGGKTINVSFADGASDADKLSAVNAALTSAGITNVSAIADGSNFKLQATEAGKNFSYSKATNSYTNATVTSGTNATYATSEKLFASVDDIISACDDSSGSAAITADGYFKINGVSISIDPLAAKEIKQYGIEYNRTSGDEKEEIAKTIQEKLAAAVNTAIGKDSNLKDKYTATVDVDGNAVLQSKTAGQADTVFTCSVGSDNKTVTNGVNATSAYLDSLSLSGIIGSSLSDINSDLIINGQTISFKRTDDNGNLLSVKEQKANLKAALEKKGFDVSGLDTTTDNIDSLNISNKTTGTAGNFTCQVRNNSTSVGQVTSGSQTNNGLNQVIKGTDANVTIRDLATGLTYTHTSGGNEITLDEVTFKIDTNATAGSTTRVNVKADGTELKDKIVEFINDYNELLGHINGKLYETYDRSYLPLTDDDKEGLSDSEIEKLEKKAQTGLLRNDSYLSNFADDMKMTMTTILEESGLSLEKIGIKPVNDYKSKNGLFTIDEDKLLAAIEENPDGIKSLFSGSNGIVTKLKKNLEEHATGTFSRLANKAGIADGVTANTNEMTKDIEQRKKLITQMQTALQEKEDALYTKYASLESSLASLQSQQSSLSSYFQ